MSKLKRLLLTKILAVCLSLFLLPLDASVYIQDSDFEDHFKQATEEYQKQEYDQVIARLNRILSYVDEKNSTFLGKIQLLLGAAHENLGNKVSAREHFLKGKELKPDMEIEGVDFSQLEIYQKVKSGEIKAVPRKKVIEKPLAAQKPGKKKKFPVLLVVGILAAAVVVIILLLKPPPDPVPAPLQTPTEYYLTVNKSVGAKGSPSSGGYYQKGSTISYWYALENYYTNLKVYLDGNPVDATGTFTMNRARTLQINTDVKTYHSSRYTYSVTNYKISDNIPKEFSKYISLSGYVQRVKYYVKMTDTYIYDLGLTLKSPAGTSFTIKEKYSSSGSGYSKSGYTDQFDNEQIKGTWKVRVDDGSSHDTVRFGTWYVEFTYSKVKGDAPMTQTFRLNPTFHRPAGKKETKGRKHLRKEEKKKGAVDIGK